jgi:mono/diheme cytochrome c family protein
VLRGGAWTEEVTKLRSASRMVETEEWNENDPQSPQSVWWLSAADFTGFRVVCDENGATAAASAPNAEAAAKPAAPTAPAAAIIVDGKDIKEVYVAQCKGCHGANGNGDTTLGKKRGARDYTSKAVKDSYNEAQWIKTINEGIEKDGSHIMGGYKDKFTADQIKALAQYLKNI